MNTQNTVLLPPDGPVPERIMWISPVHRDLGYKMTDHNGELDEPVRSCKGCRHFGVHDWHYYYCSMQYAENQRPNYSAPYPWRGAGLQMQRPNAANCPVGERSQMGGSSNPMPDEQTPEEEDAEAKKRIAYEAQRRLQRNLAKRRKK